MFKAGFIVMAVGIMCADSENLLIPLVLTAIGAVMLLIGSRREA